MKLCINGKTMKLTPTVTASSLEFGGIKGTVTTYRFQTDGSDHWVFDSYCSNTVDIVLSDTTGKQIYSRSDDIRWIVRDGVIELDKGRKLITSVVIPVCRLSSYTFPFHDLEEGKGEIVLVSDEDGVTVFCYHGFFVSHDQSQVTFLSHSRRNKLEIRAEKEKLIVNGKHKAVFINNVPTHS